MAAKVQISGHVSPILFGFDDGRIEIPSPACIVPSGMSVASNKIKML